FKLEEMRAQPADTSASQALFSELEFTTLLKTVLPTAPATLAETEYSEIRTIAGLETLLRKAKKTALSIAFPAVIAQKTVPAATAETSIGEEAIEPSAESAPESGNLFAVNGSEKSDSNVMATPAELGLSPEPGRAFT